MASGGARSRSGPPPDPNALRRDRKSDGEWTVLPAEGRAGDPPAWPLTDATARETEIWKDLWRMPQAVQWERLLQSVPVALYVRRLVEAEQRNSPTAATTLVRQLADALGLTIPGMHMHRWRIAGDQIAAKRETKTKTAAAEEPARSSARDRFQVVRGDATG
ncbi:MAG TPA: hypothetical protein VL652_34605 [Kutzneria sp.]|jgi:hypothetical protein|nr:hypothetical protein [Kutzneria sp.]